MINLHFQIIYYVNRRKGANPYAILNAFLENDEDEINMIELMHDAISVVDCLGRNRIDQLVNMLKMTGAEIEVDYNIQQFTWDCTNKKHIFKAMA